MSNEFNEQLVQSLAYDCDRRYTNTMIFVLLNAIVGCDAAKKARQEVINTEKTNMFDLVSSMSSEDPQIDITYICSKLSDFLDTL